MSTPSRLTHGLSTVPKGEPLSYYPLPDPFHTTTNSSGVCTYANDFNTVLASSEYTVTGASSTFALVSTVAGGAATLTPGGTTTASSAYKTSQFFQFVSGLESWFNCRFQASAVAGSVSFKVGLQAGSSTNDGIYFSKAASSTALALVSVVNGTSTTLVTSTTTAAAATWMDVGFHYTGSEIIVFANNAIVARVASPTIGSSSTTLTNAILTPVFQITPTATDTLTVDFVLSALEVAR